MDDILIKTQKTILTSLQSAVSQFDRKSTATDSWQITPPENVDLSCLFSATAQSLLKIE